MKNKKIIVFLIAMAVIFVLYQIYSYQSARNKVQTALDSENMTIVIENYDNERAVYGEDNFRYEQATGLVKGEANKKLSEVEKEELIGHLKEIDLLGPIWSKEKIYYFAPEDNAYRIRLTIIKEEWPYTYPMKFTVSYKHNYMSYNTYNIYRRVSLSEEFILFLDELFAENESLAKAKDLWGEENVILSDDGETFELTPGLISWFYQYTQDNDLEIAYMPEFSAAEKPDWDDLTRYIHYMDMQENNFDISLSDISKDEFQLLVEKYLPTASYTDGPSMYLNYDNECYTVRGFDFVGSNHFRLSDLTVDEEGIFTAQFVVAYFEEMMTLDVDKPSPNLQALYDFSGLEGMLYSAQVREIVEEIFLLDNYQDILDMTYYVTIEFRLTDDEEAPFQYLSCHRERLDGSEYSVKGM